MPTLRLDWIDCVPVRLAKIFAAGRGGPVFAVLLNWRATVDEDGQ
jgi:hypothetical protein